MKAKVQMSELPPAIAGSTFHCFFGDLRLILVFLFWVRRISKICAQMVDCEMFSEINFLCIQNACSGFC